VAKSNRRRIIRSTTSQSQTKKINEQKRTYGLTNVPSTYFSSGATGGLLPFGKLKPRTDVGQEYLNVTNNKNRPVLSQKTLAKYTYFFVEYDNIYTPRFDGYLYAFAVIKMLTPTTAQSAAMMLGKPQKKVTGLTETAYLESSFQHPKYTDELGNPLLFRYSEVALLTQKTPGRLDNIALGYPNFDSTPAPVSTVKGPIPAPPIVNFSTATGATSVSIATGGTVYFVDNSVWNPPSLRPTGWNWDFGATASPTGSTTRTQIVAYPTAGVYSVTLTAYNLAGTGAKTYSSFVTVT
jgi:hypothetical protein